MNNTIKLSSIKRACPNPHHKRLQKYLNESDRFTRKRYSRIVALNKGDINDWDRQNDFHFRPVNFIRPEYVVFVHNLSGYPLRLLNYIIFFELDKLTGSFSTNPLMKERFKDFCQHNGDRPSDETIRKAFRELSTHNAILSVSRNKYLLNPLIAGGSNMDVHRGLINEYCKTLIGKGRDPKSDLYPRHS